MRLIFGLLLFFAGRALAAVDEPAGCWQKKAIPCAYRTTTTEWLTVDDIKLLATPGTSFTRTGPQDFQLLQGELWVETKEDPIHILFGAKQYVIQGESWIKKQKESLRILQFTGQTRVQMGALNEVIPGGFENHWSLSDEGVLMPFAMKQTLADWNRSVGLSPEIAREKIKDYKELWKDRSENSAHFYKEVIERRIASIQEREERERQAAIIKRQEGERYRQMFRDRYFNP